MPCACRPRGANDSDRDAACNRRVWKYAHSDLIGGIRYRIGSGLPTGKMRLRRENQTGPGCQAPNPPILRTETIGPGCKRDLKKFSTRLPFARERASKLLGIRELAKTPRAGITGSRILHAHRRPVTSRVIGYGATIQSIPWRTAMPGYPPRGPRATCAGSSGGSAPRPGSSSRSRSPRDVTAPPAGPDRGARPAASSPPRNGD
jgi:hypothetical protein